MPTPSFETADERWAAVVARNSAADGRFVYAVTTTGVYCRPSCASRQPRRANVRFFADAAAAEQAGFRACKRCRPHMSGHPDDHTALVERACRVIEESEQPPKLAQLAAETGLSPTYFQRVFKAVVGVTPRQYAATQRANRVQHQLRADATVTDAIYNAGFGSSGRFYAQSAEFLGMTPSSFRKGAGGEQITYAIADCYLGRVVVAATARGICMIEFADNVQTLEQRLHERFPRATLQPGDAAFSEWLAQIVAFLEAPGRGLNLPLDIQGTAFQQRVWAALRNIPAGTTASYSDIAAQIGQPNAVRAVAQACAANHLAVAIPCHRVVRSDGDLSGYRWGTERKRTLLEREVMREN